MKIAIIHHQFAAKGGMETYLLNLVNGFGLDQDSVDIFTFRKDKNLTVPANCRVYEKKIFLPKSLRKFYFMQDINKNFRKEKYDISLSLTRTASQNIVICGGTHKGYLHHFNKAPLLKDFIELYFEKKCYRLSPHIMAHSKLVQKELEEFYNVDPKKIVLLYPPINTEKFAPNIRKDREHLKIKFGIDSTKTALLFPSTGHRRKGWFELYDAFKNLPQDKFTLIIAGNRPSNLVSDLPNIKFMGFVNEMAALYAACDFTILPSHYEPFGLVVIESLQCGTPVIISSMVGASDFVGPNEGIIFDGINSKNIIDSIKKACECNFNIAPNFATLHNLTIKHHIAQIKRICTQYD
jgi:glycosyltransferase involved in cell wall biosynthesis